MCGFIGDIIGGVVDVLGSIAEFVIDNALPIISTIAMNYIAPGFGSYLSTTFNLSNNKTVRGLSQR
jgi:phage-related protein